MASARGRPSLFNYPPLPEIKLCYAVTVLTMAYAYWGVYEASQNFKWSIGDYGIWSNLPLIGGRMKDVTNWEWSRWSPFALTFLYLYGAHAVVFNVFSHFLSEKLFVPVYTLFAISGCAYYFTPFLVGSSIVQGILIFACAQYFKNKWAVWASSLPLLYVMMNHNEKLADDPFLIYTFLAYSLLSYISFNLEVLDGKGRKEDVSAFDKALRMLFYTFYIPYLFTLIVLYPEFERQVKERTTKQRDWQDAAWFAARIAFWWITLEISLHFLYFEAICKNLPYLYALPKDQFVALGMAMGIFFHWKYVVIFGLPSIFARVDNMQPLPGPICIVRVTLYSKIWREFDRGLYQFFKNYIFVPICQPSFSLPRKIVGVFVSYGFVLLWHGFLYHNVIWILLNILALFMEMSSKVIYSIEGVRKWREANISDLAFRRILAVLQIAPFATGLYSNFYFLGGAKVGAAFVQRFMIEETLTFRWPLWLILTLGYFNSHTSMEADRWNLKEYKITISLKHEREMNKKEENNNSRGDKKKKEKTT